MAVKNVDLSNIEGKRFTSRNEKIRNVRIDSALGFFAPTEGRICDPTD